VLFAGDAAAAADPMTGEGIGQAVETGTAAIEAIDQAGPDRAAVRTLYRQQLARGMVRDHRLAGALGRILADPRRAEAVLAVVGAGGWTRRNFARWLFEDYPRAALATPARWRTDLLRQPGAYRHP
jgi:flavin-dependent dehydrogenase